MSAKGTIEVGQSADMKAVVQRSDTAQVLSTSPEDTFPEVLATSRMIALMEIGRAHV